MTILMESFGAAGSRDPSKLALPEGFHRAFSNARANANTCASFPAGPAICNATGNPADVSPHGTEIAGSPRTLNGRVFRSISSSR